jgi:hypothetical protein
MINPICAHPHHVLLTQILMIVFSATNNKVRDSWCGLESKFFLLPSPSSASLLSPSLSFPFLLFASHLDSTSLISPHSSRSIYRDWSILSLFHRDSDCSLWTSQDLLHPHDLSSAKSTRTGRRVLFRPSSNARYILPSFLFFSSI